MFQNRTDAGQQLAQRLLHLRAGDDQHSENIVVVGLPRGGVPVASEVARELNASLDVILVRKLGLPFHPEVGMGAIGEGGALILNQELIRHEGITEAQIAEAERRELIELERRSALYRRRRPRIPLAGRVVVVIDDGIATGSTAQVACKVARSAGAARIILAVPVAPRGWTTRFHGLADELISLSTPDNFSAIGQFYGNFSQTSDERVIACLEDGAVATRSSGTAPRNNDL